MNVNCLEGLRCPKCKQKDKLKILTLQWVVMTDDGNNPFDDCLDLCSNIEWCNDSPASCPECKFEGIVRDFVIKNQRKKKGI